MERNETNHNDLTSFRRLTTNTSSEKQRDLQFQIAMPSPLHLTDLSSEEMEREERQGLLRENKKKNLHGIHRDSQSSNAMAQSIGCSSKKKSCLLYIFTEGKEKGALIRINPLLWQNGGSNNFHCCKAAALFTSLFYHSILSSFLKGELWPFYYST